MPPCPPSCCNALFITCTYSAIFPILLELRPALLLSAPASQAPWFFFAGSRKKGRKTGPFGARVTYSAARAEGGLLNFNAQFRASQFIGVTKVNMKRMTFKPFGNITFISPFYNIFRFSITQFVSDSRLLIISANYCILNYNIDE